jgi:hypothetical protein
VFALYPVVEVLCQLAEMAHAVGELRSRDDSFDVAAQLIAHGARTVVSA